MTDGGCTTNFVLRQVPSDAPCEKLRDTAGVIVPPPPLIPDSVLPVGPALNFLVPMRLLGDISPDRESLLGTINFVVGVAMVIGCQLRLPTHRDPAAPFSANTGVRDHRQVRVAISLMEREQRTAR